MTAKALTLRIASAADAENIANMSRRLVEHGLHWMWRPGRITRQICNRDTVVLVALDGPRLAGFTVMHYGNDTAHLNLLAVAPEYRLTGVGRRMVEWLEETARVAGVFVVTLEVRIQNLGARCFYKALGYNETTLLRGYYQGIEDAVRMRHDLSIKGASR